MSAWRELAQADERMDAILLNLRARAAHTTDNSTRSTASARRARSSGSIVCHLRARATGRRILDGGR